MADDKITDRQVPRMEPTEVATDPIPLKEWDAAISRWTAECVRSSPISQATGAWNRLNEVLPKLRTMLNAELSKKE